MTFRFGIRRFGNVVFLGFVCGVIGAASSFLAASQLPKVYEARVSLIAPTMAETFAEVADSRSVLQSVASRLALPVTPEALASNVDARASKTSALLTIVARDPDPGRAAAIANAISEQLVQIAPAISGASSEAQQAIEADLGTVQTEITRTEAAIADLANKTNQASAQREQVQGLQSQLATLLSVRSSLLNLRVSYSQTVVTVLGSAEIPTIPSSPQAPFAGAVGGLLGLALGIGTGLLVGYMRRPAQEVGPAVLEARDSSS